MARLDGKTAVITGGASGIGRASALRFVEEGAAVVVADLNTEGGREVVAECRQKGGRAVFQRTDVTEESDVRAMLDHAVQEFGKLDILFNNAGITGFHGPIEQVPVDGWDRSITVLLRSVFLGIKHAVPLMRGNGGGSIISTGSIAGLQGFSNMHPYCAGKAAVVNLTRSAAVELAGDRIRVNCVCPGSTMTPILHRNDPAAEAALEDRLARYQPIPRAGQPDDIANMALFLASDEASWVTGRIMVVDGGALLGSTYYGMRQTEGGVASGPQVGYRGPSFMAKDS